MSDEHNEGMKNMETEKRGNPSASSGQGDETVSAGATGNGPTDAPVTSTPHPFEALLDEYPLREPSEDPVWSVRIVKGWMYFLAFNFAWMFLFFVLGIFYE